MRSPAEWPIRWRLTLVFSAAMALVLAAAGAVTVVQFRDAAHEADPDGALRGLTDDITADLVRELVTILPIVLVIAAVAATRNGRIGVIGTRATITSHAYQDAFAAARDTEITAVACPRFVDFVERGVTSGRQVLGLAQGYLEPLQRAEVDTLVLGCTHYPLLSGLIQLAMGENVTLVSSAEETAKEVVRVLTEIDLLRPHDAPPATRIFEATGDPEAFTKLAARFLGPVLGGVQPVHPSRIH